MDNEDEEEELLKACETFIGARGGNADQREAYRARAMDALISDSSVPEKRKELLRAERVVELLTSWYTNYHASSRTTDASIRMGSTIRLRPGATPGNSSKTAGCQRGCK